MGPRLPQDTDAGLRPKRRSRRLNKQLCSSCQNIDLSALSRKGNNALAGNIVCRFMKLGDLDESSCSLCSIYRRTYDFTKLRLARHYGYRLRSFSSNRIKDRGLASVETNLLSFDEHRPETFLVPQSNNQGPIRVLGNMVDIGVVKEWLDYCQAHHDKRCGVVKGLSPLSSINSFKVIDCKSRRLVRWSGQPYATLSYVWGSGSSAPDFSWTLPDEMPEIIEDAVELTRSLEIGHLWVDRFCINQKLKDEVSDQVSVMDMIYNNSELTIIGATSRGSANNLPGVRRDRAPNQPHVRVGNYQIVSSMGDPTKLIRKSRWWTRGWTYQEGLLARRRLIFTDDQVYFECRSMYCCEALKLDLPALHVKSGQRFKADFSKGLNLGIFPLNLGHQAWDILVRIEEYSKRTLTNPEDVLNGLSGVLNDFGSRSKNLCHFFGIPILPHPPRPRRGGLLYEEIRHSTYNSLVWTPTTGFCAGLAWESTRMLERRSMTPYQPTWSWTGWKTNARGSQGGWTGAVQWVFREREWRTFHGNTDVRISVQLEDGQVVPWDDFYRDHAAFSIKPVAVLRFSAWTTAINIRRCGEFVSSVQVQAEDGAAWEWELCSDVMMDGYPSEILKLSWPVQLKGIPLGERRSVMPLIYVLVIVMVAPGVYERVGIGAWSFNSLHLPDRKESGVYVGTPQALPSPLAKEWTEGTLR